MKLDSMSRLTTKSYHFSCRIGLDTSPEETTGLTKRILLSSRNYENATT